SWAWVTTPAETVATSGTRGASASAETDTRVPALVVWARTVPAAARTSGRAARMARGRGRGIAGSWLPVHHVPSRVVSSRSPHGEPPRGPLPGPGCGLRAAGYSVANALSRFAIAASPRVAGPARAGIRAVVARRARGARRGRGAGGLRAPGGAREGACGAAGSRRRPRRGGAGCRHRGGPWRRGVRQAGRPRRRRRHVAQALRPQPPGAVGGVGALGGARVHGAGRVRGPLLRA